MKNILSFVIALAGISAQATSLPSYVGRPLLRADLSVSDHGRITYPRAETLTMHENLGRSSKPVFVLVEDTGIRCIQAPCPSSQTLVFNVTEIKEIDAQTTEYTAWGLPTEIPPHVRLAPRKMVLIDFQGLQQQWTVNLTYRLPDTDQQYVGYPQPVVGE